MDGSFLVSCTLAGSLRPDPRTQWHGEQILLTSIATTSPLCSHSSNAAACRAWGN